jgi:hypothetical protein
MMKERHCENAREQSNKSDGRHGPFGPPSRGLLEGTRGSSYQDVFFAACDHH